MRVVRLAAASFTASVTLASSDGFRSTRRTAADCLGASLRFTLVSFPAASFSFARLKRTTFALEVQTNLVHGSDSAESSAREIGLFFPELS